MAAGRTAGLRRAARRLARTLERRLTLSRSLAAPSRPIPSYFFACCVPAVQYCETHFEELFAPKCAQCGLGIHGQVFSALDQQYHLDW